MRTHGRDHHVGTLALGALELWDQRPESSSVSKVQAQRSEIAHAGLGDEGGAPIPKRAPCGGVRALRALLLSPLRGRLVTYSQKTSDCAECGRPGRRVFPNLVDADGYGTWEHVFPSDHAFV